MVNDLRWPNIAALLGAGEWTNETVVEKIMERKEKEIV